MTTRRSRFLHLRTAGSINEKRFDGDPNEVRGRGEKTESLFGQGGWEPWFPIYNGYNQEVKQEIKKQRGYPNTI